MKTKFFIFIFALTISTGNIYSQTGTCGKNLTWYIEDGVLTISGTGTMTNFSDDAPWDSYRDFIQSVVINEGVTSISNYAFCWCHGLTSVTIPNTVTSIGDGAFEGCDGLTSIEIPNSVTYMGFYVFADCESLTSITISNSLQSISDYSFMVCNNLTSVTIPNSVTYIGKKAFYACTSLTSVTLPNNLRDIEDYAFYETGLTSIYIPSSVAWIEDCAFMGCRNLTAINVDSENPYFSDVDGVLFEHQSLITFPIGKSASTLTYAIPNGITSISKYAFYGCTDLTSVTIPNSVADIGQHAFEDCSGLTYIACNAITPPTLEYNIFLGVNKSIPLYVPDESVNDYKAADQWKDFNIRPISALQQSIIQINNDQSPMTNKILHDSQILILCGDKSYTLTGQEVK